MPTMLDSDKIYIKRKKKNNKSKTEKFMENFECWAAYWRANPHRFITEYLGLELYDFQKILIYQMNFYPNFIFIGGRGIAKSTIALLYAIQRCALYPEQKIILVAPTKSQGKKFLKNVYSFVDRSPNLKNEIDVSNIKMNNQEAEIPFYNGSWIKMVPYSENALGERCHLLIVDEFVRTEQDVISRVFIPFLTERRSPPYHSLSKSERIDLIKKQEPARQLYLSSIRRAEEWSYKKFQGYVKSMCEEDSRYTTVAIPYNFGVKCGFINEEIVEQSFKENPESIDIQLAEFVCIPEKSMGNSFYSYSAINKWRKLEKPMVCMSDEEYIQYKEDKTKYPYWVDKLANEIRILSMDVALVESSKNDNTAFWILRLIPDGGKYKRIFQYAESMHGINAVLQMKRAKQLFYEFNCDYFIVDANGLGQPVYDICTEETYDDGRGINYPAWTVLNPEDIKNKNRTLSPNAVPVVWCIKNGASDKSTMLTHSREILATGLVTFLTDIDVAREYLDKYYKYYQIEDMDLRARISNSFAQTNMFVNEAINLEQIVVQGMFSAKEKSGRRKDRVMSYAYALNFAQRLEQDLAKNDDWGFLDYILVG